MQGGSLRSRSTRFKGCTPIEQEELRQRLAAKFHITSDEEDADAEDGTTGEDDPAHDCESDHDGGAEGDAPDEDHGPPDEEAPDNEEGPDDEEAPDDALHPHDEDDPPLPAVPPLEEDTDSDASYLGQSQSGTTSSTEHFLVAARGREEKRGRGRGGACTPTARMM